MREDRLLIKQTLNGDTDSYIKLISRYNDNLFSFIYKMTLSKEDTKEILQEAYIHAYKSLYTYNCVSSFAVWLYRMVANEFRRYYRKKGKKIKLEKDSIDLDVLSGTEPGCQSQEDYKLVIKFINSLEENQKMALMLEPLEGFNYKDISQIIGVSVENAKLNVHKAKAVIGQKFCESQKGEK